MEPRLDAWVLWARALFVGGFACFLGMAGHVLADGLLPGTPYLVALFGVSVLLSVVVLSRPATAIRLAALMVGGQSFIHLCLTVSAGHVGDPRPPSGTTPPPLAGPARLPTVDGHRVGSFQDAFAGTGHLPAVTPTLPVQHLVDDLSGHAPMMAAHLVVAALVGLWLAHGERCLWTLVHLTGRRLLALVRPVLPVSVLVLRGTARVADLVLPPARRCWLTGQVTRRGPPLLAV